MLKRANLVYLLLLVGLSAAVQIGAGVCPRMASNASVSGVSIHAIDVSPSVVSSGRETAERKRHGVSHAQDGGGSEPSISKATLTLLRYLRQ